MKYLLVTLVVGVALWLLLFRGARGRAPRRPQPPAPPQAMVRCAHCGVHLPAGDALADGDQRYCSAAHRQLGPARR